MSDTIFGFFGLHENPFKINPDPRFLFVTDRARATAEELSYAIRTRKGLILLTGEVGTGKTMLIRHLLDWLAEQKMPTALIFNSHIQPEHLLDFILNDFGVPCTSTIRSEKLIALNRWLLERYRAGQTPVLIVDEAQGLDSTALEEVRLLLNFETPREKLLQIVLAGQPELETKLKRHELRQLRQRITIRCRTAPLTPEETYGYIRERLRIAGADGNPIFEPDAVGSVHAYSRGIPRVINVLCDHSLINACADGSQSVSPAVVDQAAHDCQLDRADSISRILSRGSYSATSLSDIGVILASVPSASKPAIEPPRRPRSTEAPPSASKEIYYPPNPRAERMDSTAAARHNELAVASTEVSTVVSPQMVATVRVAPPAVEHLVVDQDVQPGDFQAPPVFTEHTEIAAAQPPRRQPHPSPLNFLQLWSKSFFADVRATSRQLRRAIRSFEARRWDPFISSLNREINRLWSSTSNIASDPRWNELRTRAMAVSQSSWRSFSSAIQAQLTHHFGRKERESHKGLPQNAEPPRASRRRSAQSFRKWLHKPLNASRKRIERN